MKKSFLFVLSVSVFVLTSIQASYSQDDEKVYIDGRELNAITTAVPFLMIAPDSRSGAMGDVGVATSPDAYSMHWNPAKLAMIDKEMGLAISYTPWLRKLVGDIDLTYLSGYKRLNERSAIGASFLYFSLGNITFTNIQGDKIKDYRPNEFALDVAYSFMLSENLSGGISLRYIYSTLTGELNVGGTTDTHPGHAVASDVSMYYRRELKPMERKSRFAFGLNASNIGSKISYTDEGVQDFIPINLRIGTSLEMDLDVYNSISFAFDANKLMVPTPPEYDLTGTNEILAGYDPDVPVAKGIIQSFYDAPGYDEDGTRNVLSEELNEINLSFGAEYWYAKQFAIRAGYFHEHATKGNRKYFTVGIGLRLNVFGLDFAYLIPVNQRNPLENTLRFSLTFDFDGFKKQQVETE